MFKDDDFERTHPSYGMIGISRVSNGGRRRLFGSSLENHYQSYRLTIVQGRWSHGLNHDRYMGLGKHYIEVELSSQQFVDLFTSLNIGSGVPCTIRHVGGEQVEDPPRHNTEVQHVKASFGDTLKKYIAVVKEARVEIEDATKTLGAKAKDKIRHALDQMVMQYESNVPFVLNQFNEATTRVQTAAKAEIDAFVTSVLRAAGMESIAQGRFPSLLPSGEDPE